jgi:hypothetical protein
MGSSVRSGSSHPFAGSHVACRPTLARRAALAVATTTLGTLALAAPASATTRTFSFTGAAQTWTVPAGVTQAKFNLYGAQGAGIVGDPLFAAGLGGRARATIAVIPGTSIQVNVGGQGTNDAGGFNGGGSSAAGGLGALGGGGASDIRIDGTALMDRALVAGGGGARGFQTCGNGSAVGGNGGGLSGLPAGDTGCGFGVAGGGTQTEGGSATSPAVEGSFGVGGAGAQGGGSGGGGWYGGGGGAIGGGGGGSGYGPEGTFFETGVRSGNGVAIVNYTVSQTCAGEAATIVGTDGPDTLRGTNRDDVIAAKGGRDTVLGLQGDDLVCGGSGNDKLRGQGGDDDLRGGAGNDALAGGGGSNRCRGGAGSDSKRQC